MQPPISKGRKAKGRIRKTFYLDAPVVEAIEDFSAGNDSDSVNRLIRRAVKMPEEIKE